jgi:ferredoxin
MPKLKIDNREVTVADGATILQAARQLNIEIPTLCHFEAAEKPHPSCLACVVRVNGQGRLVPSCATRAEEGMVVESETSDVRLARKSAMELLFSDHVGDCIPVCQRVCPAGLQIPAVIRLVAAGHLRDAMALARETIAMPGVTGYVCRAPCESGCRRGKHDGAVMIQSIERHVAESDLEQGEPYVPLRLPPSGKRVAIVGAGPAGLATAFYLMRTGNVCVVFDAHEEAGGTLRRCVPEEELPRRILDAEIAVMTKMGMEFRSGQRVEWEKLRQEFDAVVIASGRLKDGGKLKMNVAKGVFAVGAAVHGPMQIAHALANGRAVADVVDHYFAGKPAPLTARAFTSTIPKLSDQEFERFVRGSVASLSRQELVTEAQQAAGRCCHCDCRSATECKLRHYAVEYQVDPKKHKGRRREFEIQFHPAGIVFEPGKCISCGICVEICRQAQEPLGLTHIGRGFDVKIGMPMGEALDQGLRTVARDCVTNCPTGAMAVSENASPCHKPVALS